MNKCPCGSNLTYDECCDPIIQGKKAAATAEQLMRSRYSAYAKGEIQYIFASSYPDTLKEIDEKGTREWAANCEWTNLKIIKTIDGDPQDNEGWVEFVASFKEKGINKEHHELSNFKKKDGVWYFVDGEGVAPKQFIRPTPKTGRNDPCPCGSGKKFKKCCLH